MAKTLDYQPENAPYIHLGVTAALALTAVVTKNYSTWGPFTVFYAGVTANSAYKHMNKTDTNTQESAGTDNTRHNTSKNHQETNKNDGKPSWTETLSTQNKAKTDANPSESPREITQVDSNPSVNIPDATKAEPNTNAEPITNAH